MQKGRGTHWAVTKESLVLSYSSDKKAGHARTPMLSLPRPIVPIRGNPRDVITFQLIFRCAISAWITTAKSNFDDRMSNIRQAAHIILRDPKAVADTRAGNCRRIAASRVSPCPFQIHVSPFPTSLVTQMPPLFHAIL
ncbi:hypothetical protein PoB_006837100 [Plakobranchus ocellatus]|uniref:Uncharacterized protein n=1 Tax=Plakobranchus ocellatus TaxID=259542 RepID=A0AAV4DD82_9GAST|nr:hypothetical protein PoB_006837100 [Plakobranchus ocellatus]